MGGRSTKPNPKPNPKPDPKPDPNPDPKPDLPLKQELDTPWRRFDWGQKEVLKKRLERFSLSNPDVKDIKILVAGQIGAGKSSFINSVNNIFQGRITSSAIVDSSSGTSSHSFTTKFTAHRIRSVEGDLPFTLSDIMGLECKAMCGSQPEDIIKAIRGCVKNDFKFNPEEPLSHESEDYISDPSLSDQAFGLVYILDANSVNSLDEQLTDKLHIIRKRCSENRIPQVIVMTKVDLVCPLVSEDLKKIYTSKKIKEKMEICSHEIGVPMNHIFPVKNYNDEIDIDDDIDVLILKAFDQIVNLANDRLRDAASN